jgi:RNA polymerase sigma-70 factor (ECF subfamily)
MASGRVTQAAGGRVFRRGGVGEKYAKHEGSLSEQHATGSMEQFGSEALDLARLLLCAQSERAAADPPTPAAATLPRKSAFVEFVERTQRRLAEQVLPMVRGDVHRAEDVVQETYLKVWKALPQFDPARLARRDPFAWLLKIARNTAISQGRRRRPSLRGTLTGPDGDGGRGGRIEPETPEPGPETRAQYNERDAALNRALARLAEHKRKLLELHYREALSHREIAKRCELTLGQVNMMLYSARQEIRARLERYAGDDDD